MHKCLIKLWSKYLNIYNAFLLIKVLWCTKPILFLNLNIFYICIKNWLTFKNSHKRKILYNLANIFNLLSLNKATFKYLKLCLAIIVGDKNFLELEYSSILSLYIRI